MLLLRVSLAAVVLYLLSIAVAVPAIQLVLRIVGCRGAVATAVTTITQVALFIAMALFVGYSIGRRATDHAIALSALAGLLTSSLVTVYTVLQMMLLLQSQPEASRALRLTHTYHAAAYTYYAACVLTEAAIAGLIGWIVNKRASTVAFVRDEKA
jgi:hypothetical protein